MRSATHSRFGAVGGEVALAPGRRARGRGRRATVVRLSCPARPGEPSVAHQPGHPVAADRDALAVQLPPHLAGPVDAELSLCTRAICGLQLGVADRPRRRRAAPGGVVGGRGDLQHPADRLDPERVPVGVDVRDHLRAAAVELRREESRRRLQDLVGPAQLPVLPLQLGDPLAARWRADPGPLAPVDLGLVTQLRSDSGPMPSWRATR